MFVLEGGGKDYKYNPEGQWSEQNHPAVVKKFSWSEGKVEPQLPGLGGGARAQCVQGGPRAG